MNVKKACYLKEIPGALILIFPDNTVWKATGGLGFRKITEKELSRLPGYETPAMLRMILEDQDNEIFPFCYFQYHLEKDGQDMGNLLPLKQYAERHGLLPDTVRKKCQRGNVPGAVKMGRDWLIPTDAPYPDARVKTGEYKNWRKKPEN